MADDYAEKAERYREISVNTLAHNERLMEENKRLRDLIHDLLRLPTAPAFDCFHCKYDEYDDCDYGRRCKLVERARDLGIEVDDDDEVDNDD